MIWKFAYRNLFRNKRRSLSTGVAICVGFVGLNLLGAYIYRSKMALDTTSVYPAQKGHVSIYKKDSIEQYQIKPKKYVFNIEEQAQVREVLKSFGSQIEYTGNQMSVPGLLSNGTKSHPIVLYGFTPEAFKKSLSQPDLLEWAKDWILPSQMKDSDLFIKNPETVSVTPKIAEILSFKYPLNSNDTIQIAARTLDGDLNAINAELGAEHTTGMQFLEDTVVLIPIAKVQELLATDAIESVSVYLNRSTSIDKFISELKSKLANLGFATDVYKFDAVEINALHQGTMGFLYVMGGFFLFLICTAVSLTIINSLTMGIIERTREIGTLRAVGFKSMDVVKLFVRESILLSIISMALGVLISFLVSSAVNAADIRFFPPGASAKIQFVLKWNLYIAGFVFVLLFAISTLSSYFVIKNKLRTKLIALLNDSSTFGDDTDEGET
jgi:putative ABC transport system permease protein